MKTQPMPRNQRWIAIAVAASLGWVTAPVDAVAHTTPVAALVATPVALFKKKKKKKSGKKKPKKKKKSSSKGEKQPSLTPEDAEPKRQAIRDSVATEMETDKLAAADGLETGATQLGDPVTMMEAGQLRLEVAKEEREAEPAEASIVTTTVALDMLHFYDAVASGSAESEWLVIPPSDAAGMISDAESQIEEAEAFIAELEAEAEEEDEVVADSGEKEKKKKKRDRGKMKPGTGLLIGGSIAAAAGVAGAGLAIVGLSRSRKAQSEAEDLDGVPMNQPRIDELDEEGGAANRLAYIGLGVGVVGLAVGIPLIIVGAKKRKEAGPSNSARIQVSPMVAGRTRGFAMTGRF